MARKLPLSLLPIFIVLLQTISTTNSTITKQQQNSPLKLDFIISSCKATRYPTLCIQSLSIYANAIKQDDHHLAQTAISISLARSRSVSQFVTKLAKARGLKPREHQAVKDCIENMGDSMDRLRQSVKELGFTKSRGIGEGFIWHMSNVQTWVSAALTDENTCLDGFSDRRLDHGIVKAAIRKRVIVVAQVTSNALALVNRFAAKHGVHDVDKP